jgi:cytochrome c556
MRARIGIATAAILSATILSAYAHGGATGVVMERMMIMKSIQNHMKVVGEMVQGKRNFTAETVKVAGKSIADHADEIPHKFPKGSIEEPSEATHSIWQDWEKFMKLTEELKVTALAMADAAGNANDASVIRPHFADVGKTCSACHEDFRKQN